MKDKVALYRVVDEFDFKHLEIAKTSKESEIF